MITVPNMVGWLRVNSQGGLTLDNQMIPIGPWLFLFGQFRELFLTKSWYYDSDEWWIMAHEVMM